MREVVRELPVLRHESRFGVRPGPYLLSRFAPPGGLAPAQAPVLLAAVRHFTQMPGPADPQLLVLGVTAPSGVAPGLLVSSAAGNSERAVTVPPVLLIAQAVFSGGPGGVVGAAVAFAPAYWSLDGIKSGLPGALRNATYPGARGTTSRRSSGRAGRLAPDLLAIAAQALAMLAAAWYVLRRQALAP